MIMLGLFVVTAVAGTSVLLLSAPVWVLAPTAVLLVLHLMASRGAAIRRREHLAVLMRDATYGLRLMRKYPLATAAAMVTIALGVGANTAMFTVVNAVLLQLPFEDPSRLVSVLRQDARGLPRQFR